MPVSVPLHRAYRAVLIITIGLVVGGCASHAPPLPNHNSTPASFEVSCELALIQLQQLIEEILHDSSFPAATLAEALELRQLGTALYLERDYELALEILEEGISLLEDRRE